MKHVNLATALKLFILLLGIFGLLCFGVAFPILLHQWLLILPNSAGLEMPLQIIGIIMVIVVYIALSNFWKICTRIGNKQSFCQKNVMALKRISFLAILDAGLCFITALVLFLSNLLHPTLLIALLGICLMGCLIAVASYTLGYLVNIAEKIQLENEAMV